MEYIEKRSEDKGTTCCLYVSFHDDDRTQPTLESLFVNLLMQLLRQFQPNHAISTSLQEYYAETQAQKTSPSAEECLSFLAAESSAFSKVFLIVDALDNCYSVGDPHIQDRFLKGIRQLTNKWNVLITSRSGTTTRGRLESDRELIIEATDDDIEMYVKMRLEENDEMSRLTREGLANDPSFKDNICSTITKKAQGM